ncbi:MAG: hypothetical protein U1F81_07670 [Verrucomicrobiaceae bacterium]
MTTGLRSRFASPIACLLLLATAHTVMAQAGGCSEIANDVRVAVEKDPTKVLMVVEDALVINEGCAGDIVRAAITASKADATLANQIVQTASTVAPKQVVAINEAAASIVPGVAVASAMPSAPAAAEQPVALTSEKNPGKNPVMPKNPVAPPAPEEDFFVPATIRGVFLIQPPASGPLPPPNNPNPVSPAVLK